ncbi:hypothetical protein NHX12_012996 [Muraenolepis orangiensis]|uniref:Tumor protein p53-inducible nuclear protein 2 n=1 Tax=Muraenolepis orangiensis TaxID=630683 RepID=A0A9Q0I5Z5_9TELE|nr:hypothetical protein NHX12_012996 [Muraenolepis orangiensis]
MFQRLSSLFFGEVEEVSAELKGANPCVTEADEEGWMMVNLPEASPTEDLLIEHPSMSVYVSTASLSMVSNGNLSSTTGEESALGSVRVEEQPVAPAMPTRGSRGAAAQAGALAKVTQVARVQRGKARIERRHLARNRIQRQNRVREQVPRHAAHARNTFLHQPCNRSVCH